MSDQIQNETQSWTNVTNSQVDSITPIDSNSEPPPEVLFITILLVIIVILGICFCLYRLLVAIAGCTPVYCCLLFVVWLLRLLHIPFLPPLPPNENILSKRNLRKVPIEKFDRNQYNQECSICLEDFKDGEQVRVLPCQHAFHKVCIDPWLTKSLRVCPNCKSVVFIKGMKGITDFNSEDSGQESGTPSTSQSVRVSVSVSQTQSAGNRPSQTPQASPSSNATFTSAVQPGPSGNQVTVIRPSHTSASSGTSSTQNASLLQPTLTRKSPTQASGIRSLAAPASETPDITNPPSSSSRAPSDQTQDDTEFKPENLFFLGLQVTVLRPEENRQQSPASSVASTQATPYTCSQDDLPVPEEPPSRRDETQEARNPPSK